MPGILPTEADNITKQAPPCLLHTFVHGKQWPEDILDVLL